MMSGCWYNRGLLALLILIRMLDHSYGDNLGQFSISLIIFCTYKVRFIENYRILYYHIWENVIHNTKHYYDI